MADLSARVAEAFRSLPARYLGAEPGFDATYHVRLGDIGRDWEVRCTALGARVRAGASKREPDVVIGTDAETWLQLREGALVSGVEAFSQRRLYARGDLDLAVGFEGLFREAAERPSAAAAEYHRVPVGKLKISALTMGEGPDMLLLHGLGGTKSSFFDTAAALSKRYTVHAIDLPGFGGSSKPATAPYGAVRGEGGDRDDGCARDRARAPRRQLDGRPRGDRGRAPATRPRRRDRAAQPRRGVRAPRLAVARALRPP